MPTPFGSYPFNAAGVDPYTNPQVIPSNRAPTSQDIYPQGWFIVDNSVNPPVIYQTVGNGVWESGGNAHATTSSYGTVLLNDSVTMAGASDDNVPTSLAIKTYADNLAIAGAPAWSETVSGIGQLSTLAEAAAAVDDNTAMTPLKVAAALAAGLPVTGGAGSFTTLAASGLASLSGSATITTGATALNLASDASTGAVNIGTGAGARVITIGNVTGATSVNVNTGTGSFNVATTGSGDVILNAADTVLIDSAGVLELNSSAGVIGIGNDAVAQAINIGTGAAARTITLGNASGATSLVLNAGTGAINIGTNAIAHTVTLGNVTGATAVNINAGSGGSIITTTNSALQLVSGTGAVSISADAAATTVNIGTGAAVVKTINIGGTGDNVVAIANTQTGGSLAIGAAMTTGTISIGGTGLQTGTITLGGGTGAQTVNVATGGTGIKTVHIADSLVANVVTLGSTTGAAATTIQAGTGLITMAGKIALNSSAGPQFLAGAGSPSGIVTAPQASLWLRTDGSRTTTRAYINTDSGTTWTAVTTVA